MARGFAIRRRAIWQSGAVCRDPASRRKPDRCGQPELDLDGYEGHVGAVENLKLKQSDVVQDRVRHENAA